MKNCRYLQIYLLIILLEYSFQAKFYNCNRIPFCYRNMKKQTEKEEFNVLYSSIFSNINNNCVEFAAKNDDVDVSTLHFSIKLYEGGIFRIKAKNNYSVGKRFEVICIYYPYYIIKILKFSLLKKTMYLIKKWSLTS